MCESFVSVKRFICVKFCINMNRFIYMSKTVMCVKRVIVDVLCFNNLEDRATVAVTVSNSVIVSRVLYQMRQ